MLEIAFLQYVALLAAAAAAVLAGGVLVRGSARLSALSFAAGFLLFGLQEFAHFLALRPDDGGVSLEGVRVATGARLLLPVPWLLFGLTFAEDDAWPRIRAWAPFLAALGALGLVGLVLLPLPEMFQVVPLAGLPRDVVVLGPLGKAAHILALLGIVAVLFVLEALLRQSKGETRWRIKHLAIGLFAAFAVEIYTISRFLLIPAVEAEPVLVEAAGLLIASAVVASAVASRQVFDVALHVSRHVAYRSAAAALVGGYLLILGIAGEAFRRFDIPMRDFFLGVGAFGALLALALLVFSEQMRRQVKLFIDTHFYSNKYDYRRRWVEFTQSLGPAARLDALLPRLVDTLMQTMWVRRAGVFLADGRGKDLALAHAAPGRGDTVRIPVGGPVHVALGGGQVVMLGAGEGGAGGELQAAGFVLLAPMHGPDGLVGALAVGPELSGKPFTGEDRDLLATIAGQAAAAVLTAHLSRDLAAAKGMEALHRVAAFLLHDLKNCAAVLTMVTENAREHIGDPEFQRDALEAVSTSAAKMRRLIAKISGLPSGPEIEREAMDVAEVVEEALGEFRKGLKPQVALKTDLRPTPQVLGDAAQIARVVTNLLVNAAEAVGDAGEVSVETFAAADWACLRVRDSGRGIPEATLRNGLFQPFRTTKPGGLGVGLYQCKTIAEAHGGRIQVESQEGLGSSFSLLLPAAPAAGAAEAA